MLLPTAGAHTPTGLGETKLRSARFCTLPPFGQTSQPDPVRPLPRDVEPDGADRVVEASGGLELSDVEAELLGLQHGGSLLGNGPAGAAGLLPQQIRVPVGVRRVLRRRHRREPRHRPALRRCQPVHPARVRLRARREVPDHCVQVRRRLPCAWVPEVGRSVSVDWRGEGPLLASGRGVLEEE